MINTWLSIDCFSRGTGKASPMSHVKNQLLVAVVVYFIVLNFCFLRTKAISLRFVSFPTFKFILHNWTIGHRNRRVEEIRTDFQYVWLLFTERDSYLQAHSQNKEIPSKTCSEIHAQVRRLKAQALNGLARTTEHRSQLPHREPNDSSDKCCEPGVKCKPEKLFSRFAWKTSD